LANLTDLRVLYLDNNQIQDISPLAGLTKIGNGEGNLRSSQG
jgi:Leucine-rich repeat (LRR) protein